MTKTTDVVGRTAPAAGLRDKKKLRTRQQIRDAAMRLFGTHGYTQTTVAAIAREAQVSHTTFFRYFASKEAVVITDDLEDARVAASEAIRPGLDHFGLLRELVTAHYRLAMADPWASNDDRMALIRSEPGLREAYQIESDAAFSRVTDFFADYLGVPVDDRNLQVFVAAAGGVIFHVLDREHFDPHQDDMLAGLLDSFDLLERGLPVGDDSRG